MITSAIIAFFISLLTLFSFLLPTISADATGVIEIFAGSISTLIYWALQIQPYFPIYTFLYAVCIGVGVEIALAGYHFVLWFGRRTHILG